MSKEFDEEAAAQFKAIRDDLLLKKEMLKHLSDDKFYYGYKDHKKPAIKVTEKVDPLEGMTPKQVLLWMEFKLLEGKS